MLNNNGKICSYFRAVVSQAGCEEHFQEILRGISWKKKSLMVKYVWGAMHYMYISLEIQNLH